VALRHCGLLLSRNFVLGLLLTNIIIKIPDQKVGKLQKNLKRE